MYYIATFWLILITKKKIIIPIKSLSSISLKLWINYNYITHTFGRSSESTQSLFIHELWRVSPRTGFDSPKQRISPSIETRPTLYLQATTAGYFVNFIISWDQARNSEKLFFRKLCLLIKVFRKVVYSLIQQGVTAIWQFQMQNKNLTAQHFEKKLTFLKQIKQYQNGNSFV